MKVQYNYNRLEMYPETELDKGDFIVVKNERLARDMAEVIEDDHYIIIAPDGLEKLSISQIKKLPQVKEIREEAVREFAEWFEREQDTYSAAYGSVGQSPENIKEVVRRYREYLNQQKGNKE